MDIYEQDSNIVLKAELPGVDPKDVDIRLENNVLTLRGQRKFERRGQEGELPPRGALLRLVHAARSRCPTVVDTRPASRPSYKDGVLRVALPKREEAKPKQIEINVAR